MTQNPVLILDFEFSSFRTLVGSGYLRLIVVRFLLYLTVVGPPDLEVSFYFFAFVECLVRKIVHSQVTIPTSGTRNCRLPSR